MDSQFKETKAFLLNKINKLNSNLDAKLRTRLINAAESLKILKTSIRLSPYRSYIIEKYQNLLSPPNIIEIEGKLEDLSIAASRSIIIYLNPNIDFFDNFMNNCRAFKIYNLSSIIGYAIGCCLYTSIDKIDNFQSAWEISIESFFFNLNLISKNNIYFKNFVCSFLCNELPSTSNTIDNSKITELTEIIFGSITNFKFIKKASKIFERFQNPDSQSLRSWSSNIKFTIKCSKLPQEFSNNPILTLNTNFDLTPLGLASSRRLDGMVLFGKHEFCDVRFPNDGNIDDISFALYFNSETYVIIDCSKKENSHLKRKFLENEIRKLEIGMILDFAEVALMNIVSHHIEMDPATEEMKAMLFYKFLKGELAGAFGPDQKKLTINLSKNDTKKQFLLGRGSKGLIPDIRISEDNKISRKHLYINFNGNQWTAMDPGSALGTFILLKNLDQLKSRAMSFPKVIFEEKRYYNKLDTDVESLHFSCFAVNGYSFLFMAVNKNIVS